MEDLMYDLAVKWSEGDKVDTLNIGDTVIVNNPKVPSFTVMEVSTQFLKDGLTEYHDVRRIRRAPVEIGEDVFAIIAEFKAEPEYGRWMFQRTDWDEDMWINLESTAVTLNDLTNIRAVKDEGEFL